MRFFFGKIAEREDLERFIPCFLLGAQKAWGCTPSTELHTHLPGPTGSLQGIITELRQELPNHRVRKNQQQLSCQIAICLTSLYNLHSPSPTHGHCCDTSCKSQAKQ